MPHYLVAGPRCARVGTLSEHCPAVGGDSIGTHLAVPHPVHKGLCGGALAHRPRPRRHARAVGSLRRMRSRNELPIRALSLRIYTVEHRDRSIEADRGENLYLPGAADGCAATLFAA